MNCKLFYRPKRNGVFFTEGMPIGPRPHVSWKPYKVWQGDLWECKGCHSEIIVGAGHQPIMEQYHLGFDVARRELQADKININDC
jgi:hypothetical protein